MNSPIPVLLSVPVGVLGAFLGVLIAQFSLNLYAQIGLVVLIANVSHRKGWITRV